MSAVVQGVGTTNFAKQPARPTTELIWEAVAEAERDAGPGPIEAVYVGTVYGPRGVAARSLQALGIGGVPLVTVENACASGTTAFHEAHQAVAAGRYERVLAVGVEHMTSRFSGPIVPDTTDAEGATGLAMPGMYAMTANRYLHEGWVTREQLAQVSVKNHRHAEGNPRAQYRGTYTVEEVLGSRLIADPFTLLQCCPISDAAAAAIVGAERGSGRDVPIRSSALGTGGLWDHRSPHVWGLDLVAGVAQTAYEEAGIGAADADFFEVHDAFTIGEIVTTEALGMAPVGGGGELVSAGHTTLGGAQPVNPSGGLLSRGHPLGATGVAQVAEAVWQLRGEAEGRQVEGARTAVVETMGGGVAGVDGNAAVVAVLGG
jgi:acetyl-CoA C-acetyltransferase